MTRRIFIIILIILGVAVAAIARSLITPADFETSAKKIGDLTVTWQTTPLFDVHNMLPGDTTDPKTVTITNGSNSPIPLGIRGWITTAPHDPTFTDQLFLTITQNGNPIWSGTLTNFFNIVGFLPFADLPGNQTRSYQFRVYFNSSANNDYQNDTVVFSLSVGYGTDIPEECRDIAAQPNVKFIFGTDKKETLTGGNYPNIIFGFGGNDVLNGNNLQDCLVGGNGNDKLHGNNKNDFLFGGSGDDDLNGNNGDDYLDGGPGTNKIDGSNGTDTCKNGVKSRCEL